MPQSLQDPIYTFILLQALSQNSNIIKTIYIGPNSKRPRVEHFVCFSLMADPLFYLYQSFQKYFLARFRFHHLARPSIRWTVRLYHD